MLDRVTESIPWQVLRRTGITRYLSAVYWALRVEHDPTVRREVGGYKAEFDVRDGADYYRVRSLLGEESIISCFLDHIRPNDVVFDVGGNIGTHACFVGQKLDDGEIIVFEPSPNYTSRLVTNVSRNVENGRVLQAALASEDGYTYLNMRGQGGDTIGETGEVIVPTRRGETLVSEGVTDVPDVIKIDVEGAEVDVLEGFESCLDRVRTVLCEVHPEKLDIFAATPSDVEQRLRGAGFDVTELDVREETYHLLATRSNTVPDEECD